MKELPSRCKNIRIINFNYKLTGNEDGEVAMAKAFCKILENQKNLKKLYLSFKGKTINKIIMSLKSQSHGLTCLYFKKLRLEQEAINSLTSCETLEMLGFEACYIKPQESLEDAKFHLKKLYLVENKRKHMVSEIKCFIIRSAGQNLQKLIIDEIDSDIIETILGHCSSINELFLMASEYKNVDLYHLLINLQDLRKLTLWSANDYIMNSLGNYLPNSLKHLGFVNAYCDTFDGFLKVCNVQIESLELFNFVICSNDHFKFLSEYVKNHYNHLKVIYFGNSSDMIKEELLEIDKIKEFVTVRFIGKDYNWFPNKFT